MKAGLLVTGNGALAYVTSHEKFLDDGLIRKLDVKGISKFIAYEVPVDKARAKYGEHFEMVLQDLRQEDDLRILDYDGTRAFNNFSFTELGQPVLHE